MDNYQYQLVPLKPRTSAPMTPQAGDSFQFNRTRSSKVLLACDQCRRRKAKCDGGIPCKSCAMKKEDCQYPATLRTGPTKAQHDILKSLASMQSTLNGLTSRLGKLEKTLSTMEMAISRRARKAERRAQMGKLRLPHDEDGQEVPKQSSAIFSYHDDKTDISQVSTIEITTFSLPEAQMLASHATTTPEDDSITSVLAWPSIQGLLKDHIHREGGAIHFAHEYTIRQEQSRHPLMLDTPADMTSLASASSYFYQPLNSHHRPALAGNLDLTMDKADKLADSFITRILSLHPILQPERVKACLFSLVRRASPLPHTQSNDAVYSAESFPDPMTKSGTRESGERVLALTILALGEVCMDQSFRDATSHTEPSSSMHNAIQPHLYLTPPDNYAPRQGERLPDAQGITPGLDYMKRAKGILDNCSESDLGLDIIHAEIFVGLYLGQLCRPLESFDYIRAASIRLQALLHPRLETLRRIKMDSTFIQGTQENELALTFWTCLQLETELVSEIHASPTGLLAFEDSMPYPNMDLVRGFPRDVCDSYLGHLYLRTHLNNVCRASNPLRHIPLALGNDLVGHVDHMVAAISNMQWVAPSLSFAEDDAPASGILAARIRAEYWRVQAVTYRPFIKHLLHVSHLLPLAGDCHSPPIPMASANNVHIEHERTDPAIMSTQQALVELSKRCIKALFERTRAFNGLDRDSVVVTCPFGVVHAQWENLLVLSAASRHPMLGQFVDSRELQDLFNATKTLLGRFATPGSSLATDLQLLVGLQRDMFEWRQAEGAYQWGFEQEWAAE